MYTLLSTIKTINNFENKNHNNNFILNKLVDLIMMLLLHKTKENPLKTKIIFIKYNHF